LFYISEILLACSHWCTNWWQW